MMDLDEIIAKRHSVRKYEKKKVAREDILKCIQAAVYAPSARNNQPWKFIVVDDEEKTAQIADAYELSNGKKDFFIYQVPVFVVMAYDISQDNKVRSGWRDNRYFADIDMGLAIENFCLKATELGLGTLIIGAINQEKICRILNIPEENKPKVMIALGYSAEDSVPAKVRKSLEEKVVFNGYEK